MEIKSNWKEHINHYETPTIFKDTLLKPYFNNLQIKEPLLDVGCGTGYFSELLASKGIKVIGIDQNPVKIKNSLAKYQIGEASSLPFEDSSFGFVLLINVLSAIDDEEERISALNEAKRVKTKEGKIFVINANENLFNNIQSVEVTSKRINNNYGHLKLKKIDGSYIEFDDYIISKEQMTKYATLTNLKLIEKKDFIYKPLNLNVYSLYIYKQ